MTTDQMTDGEIRREIAKHVASLDSPNADTNALKKHIETFRAELATRLESRRRPATATAAERGVYHSTLDR